MLKNPFPAGYSNFDILALGGRGKWIAMSLRPDWSQVSQVALEDLISKQQKPEAMSTTHSGERQHAERQR